MLNADLNSLKQRLNLTARTKSAKHRQLWAWKYIFWVRTMVLLR